MSPTSQFRIILLGARNFASQLLEGLPLGFWNQQRCEDAAQHEESEDLHDVVEPWSRVGGSRAPSVEWANDDLRNDSTNFAGSSAETMRGGTITGGETFARHNEGCRVGAWKKIFFCEPLVFQIGTR